MLWTGSSCICKDKIQPVRQKRRHLCYIGVGPKYMVTDHYLYVFYRMKANINNQPHMCHKIGIEVRVSSGQAHGT